MFSRVTANEVETLTLSEPIASSLEDLVLGTCGMYDPPPLGTRMWADTFHLFQQRLKRLKYFKIRSTLMYTRSGGYSPSIPYQADPALYYADVNAVNAL